MKDPAFLFYPSDFLTGTMFMNNEQIGIYIRLLCSQHQHGGIIDKVSFDSLVQGNQLIKSKFIECETGYYNERLATEMDKRNRKSNNMSEVAKVVWAKRKEEKNTIVLQKQNKSNTKVKKNDTIAIQPINVNEDIIINKDKGIIELPFNSESFLKVWNVLLKSKKWKNKSKEALQTSAFKLSKVSEKDAIQMMLNTIEGEWQGLFELKKENNGNKGTTKTDGIKRLGELANAIVQDTTNTYGV